MTKRTASEKDRACARSSESSRTQDATIDVAKHINWHRRVAMGQRLVGNEQVDAGREESFDLVDESVAPQLAVFRTGEGIRDDVGVK